MKQKKRRSEQLPKYGTPFRTNLVSLLATLPGYQEGMKKGFPLFTKEELDDFKDHHKNGLIWEDIDRILSAKGIFFKKATFRKYIQEGNISKAVGYRNTENGRVAIFPADTIAHINFIQYFYKVMDGELVDNVIDLIKDQQISYLDAVESNLSCDNIYASIFHYICFGDGDVSDAIEKALGCRPVDRDKYLKKLNEINDKFEKIIRTDIDKFVSALEKKTMGVFETIDDGKEDKNEQD